MLLRGQDTLANTFRTEGNIKFSLLTSLQDPDDSSAQLLFKFNFYASQAGCGSGSIPSQLACLCNTSVGTLSHAQDALTSAQL
jgi:hypothetical protein